MNEEVVKRNRFLGESKYGETQHDWEKRMKLEEFHKRVTGKPLFTEEVIDRIIKKSIKEYNVLYENSSYKKMFPPLKLINYLPEGIDVDEFNHIISYNPEHEDYVSTSVENNPTQDKSFGEDIQVWSVFERNKIDKYDYLDGNVLVYALKNDKDNKWKFKTKRDRQNIMNQII